MTLNALQALTWSTVAGAVAGALLLASVETNLSGWPHERRAENDSRTSSNEIALQRKAQERAQALIEASVPKREVAVR